MRKTTIVVVFIFAALAVVSPARAQIAGGFPGDVNIESHPDVLLVERFQDSIAGILNRLNGVSSNSAGMSLVTDSPAGSPLPRSLQMTSVGGTNNGGYMFKELTPLCSVPCTELYFRVYNKWSTTGTYHHAGLWIVGQNPSSAFLPGTCCDAPTGTDRFTVGVEPGSGPGGPNAFGAYAGWMEMKGSGIIDPVNCPSVTNECFYGNAFNPRPSASFGAWHYVEVRVTMNNPVSGRSGRLQIWLDNAAVPFTDLSEGSPTGSWSGNLWTTGVGSTPFEGFRWRSTTALTLSGLWLNYYTTANPAGQVGSMNWSHLVVARSRIGPISSTTLPGAPTGVNVTQILPGLSLAFLAAILVTRMRFGRGRR